MRIDGNKYKAQIYNECKYNFVYTIEYNLKIQSEEYLKRANFHLGRY